MCILRVGNAVRVADVSGQLMCAARCLRRLTHGTLPWTQDYDRRTLFYKYSPRGTSYSQRYYDENEYKSYDDVTDRHRYGAQSGMRLRFYEC